MFKIKLIHGEAVYGGKGKTVEEALAELKFDYFTIKTKCLLAISDGNAEKVITLYPHQVKRIARNKLFREILAGKLLTLMGKK